MIGNGLNPTVFLIGGAPGAGKTTLGTALATRLSIRSLSIDDLVTAVQAVTTPATHPGLHLMWKTSAHQYFTNSTVDELRADASRQHEVAWPFIRKVIEKHLMQASPIVIDGWHLWPSRVAQLPSERIWAGWIVVVPSVLQERESKNAAWFAGSSDAERMVANFLARSLWFNDLMEAQAAAFKMNILRQDGTMSVADLCTLVLQSAAPQ